MKIKIQEIKNRDYSYKGEVENKLNFIKELKKNFKCQI